MTPTPAPPSGFISPLRRHKPRQESAIARRRYRRALVALARAGVPYVVGGAYAMERYTGIARWTKDLDIFILPRDLDVTLERLRAAGFQTEVPFPHWLAKAYAARDFVDLIFGSGNGIAEVDEDWMRYGTPGTVLGVPVRLCPPEEMIWSKAYVAERERYDGADIAHLIRAGHDDLDWERLLRRFGDHWRLLLSHLVQFEFVYPNEPAPRVRALARRLARRLAEEGDPADGAPVCQGTLLSRAQYLPDITVWGYADARVLPHGRMTEEHVARWTAAVGQDEEARDAHRGGG